MTTLSTGTARHAKPGQTNGELQSATSTRSTVVSWKVEALDALIRQAQRNGENSVAWSPMFDGGRWELELSAPPRPVPDDEDEDDSLDDDDEEDYYRPPPRLHTADVWLICHPSMADVHAGRGNAWRREGLKKVQLEFVASNHSDLPHALKHTSGTVLSENNPDVQFNNAVRLDYFTNSVAYGPTLTIRCTIEEEPVVHPGSSSSSSSSSSSGALERRPFPARHFLNEPAYSDIAFSIKLDGHEKPYYILAQQTPLRMQSPYFRDLLDSGFSESATPIRIEVPLHSKPSSPANTLEGDSNEFAHFEALLPSAEDKEGSDESALDTPTQAVSGSAGEEGGGGRAKAKTKNGEREEEEEGEEGPPAKKRRLVREGMREVEVRLIEVNNCSYSAYLSLLEYLYSSEIAFFPSVSNFLVAEFSPHASTSSALTAAPTVAGLYLPDPPVLTLPPLVPLADTEAAASGPAEPQPQPFSAERRDKWVEEQWRQKEVKKGARGGGGGGGAGKESGGPQPCSAHAVYRLADRYMIEDLKDVAAQFIVEGLTVENAAYEAFSQLSIDFSSLRKPIVNFIVENWTTIKSTPSLSHALSLLTSGHLPEGAPILLEVLDGLRPKPPAAAKNSVSGTGAATGYYPHTSLGPAPGIPVNRAPERLPGLVKY